MEKMARNRALSAALGGLAAGSERGKQIDFSTWEGFGLLWEWAQEQFWWSDFCFDLNWGQHLQNDYLISFNPEDIQPDRFANLIYADLLKRRIIVMAPLEADPVVVALPSLLPSFGL